MTRMMVLTLALLLMIKVFNSQYLEEFFLNENLDGRVTARGCSTKNNICEDVTAEEAKPKCK